jgi:hypothetical protein
MNKFISHVATLIDNPTSRNDELTLMRIEITPHSQSRKKVHKPKNL